MSMISDMEDLIAIVVIGGVVITVTPIVVASWGNIVKFATPFGNLLYSLLPKDAQKAAATTTTTTSDTTTTTTPTAIALPFDWREYAKSVVRLGTIPVLGGVAVPVGYFMEELSKRLADLQYSKQGVNLTQADVDAVTNDTYYKLQHVPHLVNYTDGNYTTAPINKTVINQTADTSSCRIPAEFEACLLRNERKKYWDLPRSDICVAALNLPVEHPCRNLDVNGLTLDEATLNAKYEIFVAQEKEKRAYDKAAVMKARFIDASLAKGNPAVGYASFPRLLTDKECKSAKGLPYKTDWTNNAQRCGKDEQPVGLLDAGAFSQTHCCVLGGLIPGFTTGAKAVTVRKTLDKMLGVTK